MVHLTTTRGTISRQPAGQVRLINDDVCAERKDGRRPVKRWKGRIKLNPDSGQAIYGLDWPEVWRELRKEKGHDWFAGATISWIALSHALCLVLAPLIA